MYDYHQPDPAGHFGIYGGSFVSETLTAAINELKDAYARYQNDPLVQVQMAPPRVRDNATRHHVTIGGFTLDSTKSKLVVCATIDNLLKGAATPVA